VKKLGFLKCLFSGAPSREASLAVQMITCASYLDGSLIFLAQCAVMTKPVVIFHPSFAAVLSDFAANITGSLDTERGRIAIDGEDHATTAPSVSARVAWRLIPKDFCRCHLIHLVESR